MCSYRSRAYKRRCSRPKKKDYVIKMLKVCSEKRCAVLFTFLTGALNADPDPGDKIVLLLWKNVNWKVCKNFVFGCQFQMLKKIKIKQRRFRLFLRAPLRGLQDLDPYLDFFRACRILICRKRKRIRTPVWCVKQVEKGMYSAHISQKWENIKRTEKGSVPQKPENVTETVKKGDRI